MSNYRLPALRYDRNQQQGPRRIDGHAPNVTPTAGHDWTAFDQAFHGAPLDRAADFIPNPPPTDAQKQPPVVQSTAPNAAAAVNPRATGEESGEDWQNIQAKNAATYKPHDPVVSARAPSVVPRDVNSDVTQAALDRAAGLAPGSTTQGIRTPTGYGTASVRYAAPQEAETAATPIMEGGKQIGVGRGDPEYNQGAARLALQKAYPEVFQAGTPQNRAFIAHAAQYGEQSAHENAGKILNPTYATGTNPGPAETQSSLGTPQEQRASQTALDTDARLHPQTKPGDIVTPDSGLGRAVTAVKDTANGVLNGTNNAVSTGLQKVGITPEYADKASQLIGGIGGHVIAGAVNPVQQIAAATQSNLVQHPIDTVASWFKGNNNADNTASAPAQPQAAPATTAPKPGPVDQTQAAQPLTPPAKAPATSASTDDDEEAWKKGLAAQPAQ